ncbi:transposase [Planctomycetota bacterium]
MTRARVLTCKSLVDTSSIIDITVWFSQDPIEAWTPQKTGKQGGQPVYSNIAIETSLSLRLIFELPLHQTEGFLGSLLRLMSLHPTGAIPFLNSSVFRPDFRDQP